MKIHVQSQMMEEFRVTYQSVLDPLLVLVRKLTTELFW